MTDYAALAAGDPAPWFYGVTPRNPRFVFDSTAGRNIVLCFLGTARLPSTAAALAAIAARRAVLDDTHACLFTVTTDPADIADGRLSECLPGIRAFIDSDHSLSRLYGAAARTEGLYRPRWILMSPDLRITAVVPFRQDGSDGAEVFDRLAAMPTPGTLAGMSVHAPILMLPDVFELALCADLIARYEAHGGEISGFMREVSGKTVPVHDRGHKVRRDFNIEDEGLMRALQQRVVRRIVPMIARAHQFHVTRMERYIVACYAAEDGGHFNAHRDNTTKGTAHRRFAVSINLNDDFDGGEVGFAEYGPRRYKAPAGGAVVFSCSMLHSVSPVTRGARYAFLPFLYDDAAAALRAENLKFLETAPKPAVPSGLTGARICVIGPNALDLPALRGLGPPRIIRRPAEAKSSAP